MKKFFAVFLALLLALSLVACGNTGEDAGADATTTSTSASTTTTTGASFVKPTDYAAVLQLSINPQFRLYLNAAGTVLAVEYANADAASLQADIAVANTGYEAAIATIVTVANDNDFVQTNAVIRVELLEKKDGAADDLLTKAEQSITNLSVTLNLTVTVETEDKTASTTSTTTTTTKATTTTTTTAKPTTTTTTAAANKNPQTDLEFDLEYIGNFIDNESVLDASALLFESVEGGFCVVTSRMFEAEQSDPAQTPFEYYGKQWYSIGGGLDPHYYELTATEIIVKGSLWGEDPDTVNIRLVLQADGTLKVTEVCSDLAERFPVGTVMKIYFR